jgi:hypothetical protein
MMKDLLAGIAILAFLASPFVLFNIAVKANKEEGIRQDMKRKIFNQECLKDHKQYECDSMWADVRYLK